MQTKHIALFLVNNFDDDTAPGLLVYFIISIKVNEEQSFNFTSLKLHIYNFPTSQKSNHTNLLQCRNWHQHFIVLWWNTPIRSYWFEAHKLVPRNATRSQLLIYINRQKLHVPSINYASQLQLQYQTLDFNCNPFINIINTINQYIKRHEDRIRI